MKNYESIEYGEPPRVVLNQEPPIRLDIRMKRRDLSEGVLPHLLLKPTENFKIVLNHGEEFIFQSSSHAFVQGGR